MQKMSLILPYEFEVVFKSLPLEDAGLLILAIYAYEQRCVEPDFSKKPALLFAWTTHIKPRIDENVERYKATCEVRRQSGSKGGKATQEKQRKANQANASFSKQTKQSEANQADYDDDGDYDCDVDINNKKENQVKEKSPFSDDALEVSKLWEQRFGLVSSYRMQNIQDLIDDYGKELAIFSIKVAHQKGISDFQYIKAIARNEKMRKESEPVIRDSPAEIGERIKNKTAKRRKDGKNVNFQKLSQIMREKKVGYEEALRMMREEENGEGVHE